MFVHFESILTLKSYGYSGQGVMHKEQLIDIFVIAI